MDNKKNIFSESEQNSLYEKAEIDQLRTALKRTYEERFIAMTKLMKMNILFKKGTVTHQPFKATDKS